MDQDPDHKGRPKQAMAQYEGDLQSSRAIALCVEEKGLPPLDRSAKLPTHVQVVKSRILKGPYLPACLLKAILLYEVSPAVMRCQLFTPDLGILSTTIEYIA